MLLRGVRRYANLEPQPRPVTRSQGVRVRGRGRAPQLSTSQG